MPSEYRYIEAKQLEAGQQFGRMLRRWRELNHWTQYTAYKWAREAGFEVMAPSTLSVLGAIISKPASLAHLYAVYWVQWFSSRQRRSIRPNC